jgi:hypothetical protein
MNCWRPDLRHRWFFDAAALMHVSICACLPGGARHAITLDSAALVDELDTPSALVDLGLGLLYVLLDLRILGELVSGHSRAAAPPHAALPTAMKIVAAMSHEPPSLSPSPPSQARLGSDHTRALIDRHEVLSGLARMTDASRVRG